MRGCFIFILITAAIIAIYNKADSFSNNVETPAKLVYINQDINKHICVLNSNEDIFGRMTNMSARDCAKFYYANNSKYSFVDSIYTKQVLPIIFDGNSFDIVETYKVLKGTSSMQNTSGAINFARPHLYI